MNAWELSPMCASVQTSDSIECDSCKHARIERFRFNSRSKAGNMAANSKRESMRRGYARSIRFEDLVGVAEIALRTERSRAVVGNYAARWSDWPKPVRVLESGAIYSWREVLDCLTRHGRISESAQV